MQTVDRSDAIELKTDNVFHRNVDFAAGTAGKMLTARVNFFLVVY